MKHVLTILFLSCLAFGQGVRYDAIFPTTANQTPPYLMATPAPKVAVCNKPANAVPCTNYATTYTSITLATACSNTTQVVAQGTSLCTNVGDAQGNIGFWVATGTYDYTVCTSVRCYGPFTITVGTGGGGGGGGSSTALIFTPLAVVPVCTPSCSVAFAPATGTSNDFKVSLTANIASSTFNVSGVAPGTQFIFHITQDGTGGRTFVWPTNVLGAIDIDAQAVPNSVYTAMFMYNGTNLVATNPGVIYP